MFQSKCSFVCVAISFWKDTLHKNLQVHELTTCASYASQLHLLHLQLKSKSWHQHPKAKPSILPIFDVHHPLQELLVPKPHMNSSI